MISQMQQNEQPELKWNNLLHWHVTSADRKDTISNVAVASSLSTDECGSQGFLTETPLTFLVQSMYLENAESSDIVQSILFFCFWSFSCVDNTNTLVSMTRKLGYVYRDAMFLVKSLPL